MTSESSTREATGRGPEGDSVRVTVDERGRLVVRTGSGPSGQGHETFLAQIAADAGQRDLDDVYVTTGDPRDLTMNVPTAASRTAVLTGSATVRAVRNLVDAAKTVIAAEVIGDPEATVVQSVTGFAVPGHGRSVTQEGDAVMADPDQVAHCLCRAEPVGTDHRVDLQADRRPVHADDRRAGPLLGRQIGLVGAGRDQQQPVCMPGAELAGQGLLTDRVAVQAGREHQHAGRDRHVFHRALDRRGERVGDVLQE